MLLSILIPTIVGREKQFESLIQSLNVSNISIYDVEILHLKDNKEMPIGEKRQRLYEMASGEYSIQIDDDEELEPFFVDLIYAALTTKPDCVTFIEKIVFPDGSSALCNHSLKYKGWDTNQDSFAAVRTPFYKNAIKTEIAKRIGVNPMRFGEDHDFSKRLRHDLVSEAHIDRIMITYHMPDITTQKDIITRYGI